MKALLFEMAEEIWRKRVHEAMGAFLCEIPATSGFSASFGSSFLEIRIHYPASLAENSLKKPKKKVPPSKVRRNRRRLLKFLDKPEVQSDLPPASRKISGEGEETPAPPLFPSLETDDGKAFKDLQPDTTYADIVTTPSPSQGGKDKEQGKEMNSVSSKFSSENEGMKDDEIGLDNNLRFKEGIRNDSVPTKWAAPHERVYPCPRPDPTRRQFGQPFNGANTENLRSDLPRRREGGLEPPRRRREEGLEPPRRPTREEEQLVRTVRVPAHKISDREFVKIERKQRKNKEYQTDCKAS